MKNSKIMIFVVSFLFIICFTFSFKSVQISKNIVSTFFDNIFPTLLPFFICTYLLLETNVLEIIAYIFQFITIPLLKINGYGCLIIIVSIITGTPFAASFLTSLFLKKKISKKEAFILSISCFYPSWSFMYLTVGQFLGYKIATKICLSIYLASFFFLFILSIFFLEKPKYLTLKEVKENISNASKNFQFSKMLKKTILQSISTLMVILGTMIYFSLPLIIIKKEIILQSLIEFSTATFTIIKTSNINKVFYLLFTFSFGSFSLMIQHLSMLEEIKIKFKHLLLSRIFVIPFSFIFLILLT